MIDALLVKAETLIREKSMTAYKRVRRQYSAAIEDAILDYFIGSDAVTAYRNAMSRAMSDAFLSAFELAYIDGGAELPLDDDALEWLASRQEQELGYIRELFVSLKELKAQYRAGDVKTADIKAEMVRRRDGYLATLDMIYTEGKMRGGKNIMLTMVGDDGAESCRDCQRNKGKRYSAKKWLAIGYPPSRDYECHGYNCQHYLVTDDGKRFTP